MKWVNIFHRQNLFFQTKSLPNNIFFVLRSTVNNIKLFFLSKKYLTNNIFYFIIKDIIKTGVVLNVWYEKK